MKEIHFYTNLCNEEQISDEHITDVITDWVNTEKAIENPYMDMVRTTQLSFLDNSFDYIDKGYRVFIHNDNYALEVMEKMAGTEREIRRGHRISKILIGGGFGELK